MSVSPSKPRPAGALRGEAFRGGRGLSRHELTIMAVSPPMRRAGSRSVDAPCDEHYELAIMAVSPPMRRAGSRSLDALCDGRHELDAMAVSPPRRVGSQSVDCSFAMCDTSEYLGSLDDFVSGYTGTFVPEEEAEPDDPGADYRTPDQHQALAAALWTIAHGHAMLTSPEGRRMERFPPRDTTLGARTPFPTGRRGNHSVLAPLVLPVTPRARPSASSLSTNAFPGRRRRVLTDPLPSLGELLSCSATYTTRIGDS